MAVNHHQLTPSENRVYDKLFRLRLLEGRISQIPQLKSKVTQPLSNRLLCFEFSYKICKSIKLSPRRSSSPQVAAVIHSPPSARLIISARLRQGHNRFLERVKLICLREAAATSSLSAIKNKGGGGCGQGCGVKIQSDEMSCDSWYSGAAGADEMDAQQRLEIMSFSQSSQEGSRLLWLSWGARREGVWLGEGEGRRGTWEGQLRQPERQQSQQARGR